MNVLITGATTPLGEALIDHLLEHKTTGTILAIGRETEGRWTDRRVSYLAIDLRRPRAVHDLLEGPAQELAIEAVVHAAHHRDPHDIGRRVHAQNVESTRALVLGCAAHATIRRFVYRSFAEVYA
ncbi:MAG: NAD-dependent epimerase/dehydratase family protein, partial [Proteobacteria bacterium]|nr:NAD-dependent epimerase/dehydratase family protein [Pseudomonadota bacterium]